MNCHSILGTKITKFNLVNTYQSPCHERHGVGCCGAEKHIKNYLQAWLHIFQCLDKKCIPNNYCKNIKLNSCFSTDELKFSKGMREERLILEKLVYGRQYLHFIFSGNGGTRPGRLDKQTHRAMKRKGRYRQQRKGYGPEGNCYLQLHNKSWAVVRERTGDAGCGCLDGLQGRAGPWRTNISCCPFV